MQTEVVFAKAVLLRSQGFSGERDKMRSSTNARCAVLAILVFTLLTIRSASAQDAPDQAVPQVEVGEFAVTGGDICSAAVTLSMQVGISHPDGIGLVFAGARREGQMEIYGGILADAPYGENLGTTYSQNVSIEVPVGAGSGNWILEVAASGARGPGNPYPLETQKTITFELSGDCLPTDPPGPPAPSDIIGATWERDAVSLCESAPSNNLVVAMGSTDKPIDVIGVFVTNGAGLYPTELQHPADPYADPMIYQLRIDPSRPPTPGGIWSLTKIEIYTDDGEAYEKWYTPGELTFNVTPCSEPAPTGTMPVPTATPGPNPEPPTTGSTPALTPQPPGTGATPGPTPQPPNIGFTG